MAVLVQTALNQYVTKTTLAVAAASADSANKTIVTTGAESVAATLTVAATRRVKIEKGSTVTIASGQTLTISGDIENNGVIAGAGALVLNGSYRGAGTISVSGAITVNCGFNVGKHSVFTGSGTVSGLMKAYPENFGATGDGATDDTTAVQKALTSCKYVVFEDTYGVTAHLSPQTGSKIEVNGSIVALAAWSDASGVIEYDGGAAVANMENCQLTGKGSINAAGYADIGVYVKYGRRISVDINRVLGANDYGIKMGDTGAAGSSYECHVKGTVVNWVSGSDNGATSVGIYYANCTDSNVENTTVVGYRTGYRNDTASINYVGNHAWTLNTYGPMVYCYYFGASCMGANNYADTPTNKNNAGTDGTITDVYGFYINADGVNLVNSRIYLNSSHATDNIASAIYINRASGFYGNIQGARASAAASTKFKTIVGWAGTGNMVNSNIIGIESDANTYAYGYNTNELRLALGVHGDLTIYSGATAVVTITTGGHIHCALPGYANNAAALAGGLVAGDWYRDTDDSKVTIVYAT